MRRIPAPAGEDVRLVDQPLQREVVGQEGLAVFVLAIVVCLAFATRLLRSRGKRRVARWAGGLVGWLGG